MEHEDVKVFIGPTLSIATARAFLDAQYLPPASRGDIYRASKLEPRIIVLIDGSFESNAAVLHQEILWALSKGIAVVGAASIGALRAAELQPFGMIGIGKIFEAYRNATLERDDAVAVVHGPAELGYPLLSIAIVDIWATLDCAFEVEKLSADERALLRDITSEFFYKQLSFDALLETAVRRGYPSERARILGEHLASTGVFSQKSADAIKALQAIADKSILLTQDSGKKFVFERTFAWESLVTEQEENSNSFDQATSSVQSEIELAAIGLVLAEMETQRRGFVLDQTSFEETARRFRYQNKLSKFSDVQRWMEAAQLNHEDYVKLIEDEFFISKARALADQRQKNVASRLHRRRRSALAFLRNM